MPSRRARQRRRHAPRICAAFVGELHAARSRGTPTLPALESRLPNEKGNLSGETTLELYWFFAFFWLARGEGEVVADAVAAPRAGVGTYGHARCLCTRGSDGRRENTGAEFNRQ